MSKLVINYNTDEVTDFINQIPLKLISEQINNSLFAMTCDEAQEEIRYNNFLETLSNIAKPYKFEQIDKIYLSNTGDIVLDLKVKDRYQRKAPMLVPYNSVWFVCSNGPTLDDITMCDSFEEVCSTFNKKFSGEWSFTYLCIMDDMLNVIDWHTFYDYFENKDDIKKIREIISKEYRKYLKVSKEI